MRRFTCTPYFIMITAVVCSVLFATFYLPSLSKDSEPYIFSEGSSAIVSNIGYKVAKEFPAAGSAAVCHDDDHGSSRIGGSASSSSSQSQQRRQQEKEKRDPKRLNIYEHMTKHGAKQCTTEQLYNISQQLPSDACFKHSKHPYSLKCSFSFATKCPKATWIEEYYVEQAQKSPYFWSFSSETNPFIGISVGCNKGYDAVQTLRIGTLNPDFDIVTWDMARSWSLEATHGIEFDIDASENRCGQNNYDNQFRIPKTKTVTKDGDTEDVVVSPRNGKMYCIEALPSNYKTLYDAAYKITKYDEIGFNVTHAAISRNAAGGSVWFPKGEGSAPGVENLGLSLCDKYVGSDKEHHKDRLETECVQVPTYNLNTYVEQFVFPKEDGASNNRADSILPPLTINHVSIDVEGHDMDVLLGAANTDMDKLRNNTFDVNSAKFSSSVLHKIEYLEFEYNWVGNWQNYKLTEAIGLLDMFNFTCYWIGNDELWRITNCMPPSSKPESAETDNTRDDGSRQKEGSNGNYDNHYYNQHFWSNVGCVKRTQYGLYKKMEKKFMKTLEIPRKQLNYWKEYHENVIMVDLQRAALQRRQQQGNKQISSVNG